MRHSKYKKHLVKKRLKTSSHFASQVTAYLKNLYICTGKQCKNTKQVNHFFRSVVCVAQAPSPPHFPLQGPNQQARPSCPSQPLPGVAIIFWSNINATILYLLTNPQPINIICQLFTDPEVCSQVPGGYIDQGSECIIDFLSSPNPTLPPERRVLFLFSLPRPPFSSTFISSPFFYISPFLFCLCVF